MLNPNGITPAYAGKSPYPVALTLSGGDHPRVCGEKIQGFADGCPDSGSPPRMRGKEKATQLNTWESRITPAYAGKRGRNKSRQPSAEDHPRVCGEKQKQVNRILSGLGSPPRMRGKD